MDRKVKSATRADDDETQIPKPRSYIPQATAETRENPKLQTPGGTKITDRPSSASAGQRFIGKTQNLRELFEKNWQSVNFSQKVDPSSGHQTHIKSLTVLDTNKMVHEDYETLASTALPLQPGTRIVIPNHEPTKCSFKRNGIVRAYAANTN